MPVLPPHDPTTNKRSKPQQDPHNVHPNPTFHPPTIPIPTTVNPAKQHPKDAQQNNPEEKDNPIQIEGPKTPHERQDVDHG
jgi:hypothetical protein